MIAHKLLNFRYLTRALVTFLMLLAISPGLSIAAPPYTPYFNPAEGFKPVQPSLAKAFLKLAGSLEHFGTPENYIRHVLAEHERIDAAYRAKGGEGSSRPAYLTDEYADNLIANWNKMAAPLELGDFCRQAGKNMRYAILGTKNMTTLELASIETNLTEKEMATYLDLLEKPYFKRTDFKAMEVFYETAFDKLTETGQTQISHRTMLGTLDPDARTKELSKIITGTALLNFLNQNQDATVARIEDRSKPKANADTLQANLIEFLKLEKPLDLAPGLDAFDSEGLIYAHKIRDEYMRRILAVRKTAKTPEQAAKIEKAMRLMLENLVVLVHSEFTAGVYQ